MEKLDIEKIVSYRKRFYDFGTVIKAVPARFKFACHDLQNLDSLILSRNEVLRSQKPISVLVSGCGFWMDASVKKRHIVLDKYNISI